jgi:hypothetical protein
LVTNQIAKDDDSRRPHRSGRALQELLLSNAPRRANGVFAAHQKHDAQHSTIVDVVPNLLVGEIALISQTDSAYASPMNVSNSATQPSRASLLVASSPGNTSPTKSKLWNISELCGPEHGTPRTDLNLVDGFGAKTVAGLHTNQTSLASAESDGFM